MKKLKTTAFLLSAMLLFACGNTAKDGQEESTEAKAQQEETTNHEGMDLVDLSDYNIPAEIYIPGEQKGQPKIEESAIGSVEIEISKRFGIEITPFGMSKSEKKEELEGDLVYSIEYLEEDENMVLYKKSIEGSEVDPEFHFFYQTEIDGDDYSIESLTDRAYTKGAAEKMLQSAKSLSGKVIS